MGSRACALAVLALLAAVAAPIAQGKIFESYVTVDDRPLIPLAEAFGFAPGGEHC